MRNKTFGQWLGLLFVLGLIIVVAVAGNVLSFTLAEYSDTQERLISSIKTGDTVKTKNELIKLHYFYELSEKWRVRWLADKYLLRDASYYEVADAYLIRDWKKVMDDLKNKRDDPRAYPYGNARFRQIQALFQEKAIKFEEALELVLKEVSTDFERDLKNCLDSGVPYLQCYDRVWNYDLATNKKDAEEALKNPGPMPKYILGPLRQKDAPPLLPQDKNKKDGDREGEGEGGQGGPRKRP